MAITNAMIIFNAQMELMEQGKIGTTGRTIKIQFEDGEKELPEPEDIHTFAFWKDHGFLVKKGEHAVAKLRIWKGAPQTVEITGKHPKTGEDVTVTEETTRMFMKTAHFFSASQVAPIA